MQRREEPPPPASPLNLRVRLNPLALTPADPSPAGLATAPAAAGARAMLTLSWDAYPAPGLAPALASRPGAGWKGLAVPLRELAARLIAGGPPGPASAAAALAAGPLAALPAGRPLAAGRLGAGRQPFP